MNMKNIVALLEGKLSTMSSSSTDSRVWTQIQTQRVQSIRGVSCGGCCASPCVASSWQMTRLCVDGRGLGRCTDGGGPTREANRKRV